MTDRRFDASQAHRLDAPERLLWLPPAEVVSALGVQPGDTIADVGAGTGYFSFPLAAATGPHGTVFAVDAQAEMLAHLRLKLNRDAVSNIELIHAEGDETTLPGASCNLVFLANVWHEFPDRAAVLREAKRILKPGGRIAILDWRPDVEREAGPPLDHRISASYALDEFCSAGFKHSTHANLGKYSWLVQGEMLK
jgi:ubiquinone/menaquinone biosynthesis C-methylase UbiE